MRKGWVNLLNKWVNFISIGIFCRKRAVFRKNLHSWKKVFTRPAVVTGATNFKSAQILIITAVSKDFGNHIMKKPPGQLVRIVFWSAWEQMVQNADIWPKMPELRRNCPFYVQPWFLGQKCILSQKNDQIF